MVDAEAGGRQCRTADALDDELGTVADAHQVVHYPHQVQQEQAAYQHEEMDGKGSVQQVAAPPEVVEDDDRQHRHHDAGEEGDTPQTGDGNGMQLTPSRLVEQTAAEGDQGDAGQHDGTQHETGGPSHDDFRDMNQIHNDI